jgi:hypothetical protein
VKAQIDKLETNSKIKNIADLGGGISNFKKDFQPRTIVKNEKGDLVTDSNSILSRWRNHFSQLLDVHGVNHVRRTEIRAAEPSASDVVMAIGKLSRHISLGTDQILAELILTKHFAVRSINLSIWNK